MKYIGFLLFVALLFVCECRNDSTKEEWKRFKLQFNKTYTTNKEELKRYKVFKDNLKNIHKHNKRFDKGKETYLQEMNRFGDLTDKEFGDIYGLAENDFVIKYDDNTKVKEKKGGNISTSNSKDEFLDWSKTGAVTPAKDQGTCGSCWIFSAVAALESYNFRKTGKLVAFSEQNIVDCYSNDTCDGGIPESAAEYIYNNGIHLESDYPYTAGQDACKVLIKPPIRIAFNDTSYTRGTDEDLKQGVKEHGPLSVCLYVTAKWRFYSSGVWYHNKCSPYSNHCVLLVGYGTEKGNDYWIFKNSWGPNWGQNGYIKVARNKHENYCGISHGMFITDQKSERIPDFLQENSL
ncbi:crustapain-like [Diabrotica undecimpunctata]|uniref:crustapain-like n=1 Tax=Diabrotica undecimpunctata TaxID=50387 RepID=UPI003B63C03C